MSDTVKLIIEIPKEKLNIIKNKMYCGIYDSELYEAIANGTPLDDVKAKIKAMFPPYGDWMYDEEYEHEHTVCEVLSDVLQILDNIGKSESEE